MNNKPMFAQEDPSTDASCSHRLVAIVPSFAEGRELQQVFRQLLALPGIAHTVVVDATPNTMPERQTAAALLHACAPGEERATVILDAPKGRARQQNAGVGEIADASVYVFVHADSVLPADFDRCIVTAIKSGCRWGRFDVRLNADGWVFRMVETAMNWRSRLSGICTGDQCIFVDAALFRAVGGFPDQPLMEDIELTARLKRLAGRPAALRQQVATSARRWQVDGAFRTIMLMWRLRLQYALGTPVAEIAARYANTRSRS